MGFLDKLLLNGVFNPPEEDPLFGGLIPFRRQMPQMIQSEMPGMIQPGAFARQSSGMGDKGMLARLPKEGGVDASPQRNVRYQDTDIDRARLGLDREKLRHTMNVDREQLSDVDMKMALEQQKFASDEKVTKEKLGNERSKLEIDQRKQALDEWQAKNPQGEIKVDDKGNIVVINKQTGKSIETGLKSGDLTEEEKIKRNFAGQKEVEELRQKNRLGLEDKRQSGRNNEITPAEQRIAEDDAAAELLRGKYANLSKRITRNRDGSMQFKRYGDPELDKHFDAFEADLKTAATARMNRTKTPNVSTPEVTLSGDIVDMVDPNGAPLKVPKADVERMKAAGAKVK